MLILNNDNDSDNNDNNNNDNRDNNNNDNSNNSNNDTTTTITTTNNNNIPRIVRLPPPFESISGDHPVRVSMQAPFPYQGTPERNHRLAPAMNLWEPP